MKTTHKKTSPNTWKNGKFGQTPVITNSINSIFKFNRVLHNQGFTAYPIDKFTRIEKDEVLAIETEALRNQGRMYANITPIR